MKPGTMISQKHAVEVIPAVSSVKKIAIAEVVGGARSVMGSCLPEIRVRHVEVLMWLMVGSVWV